MNTHTLNIQGGPRNDFPSYGVAVAALDRWAQGLGCTARSDSETAFTVRDDHGDVLTFAWIRPCPPTFTVTVDVDGAVWARNYGTGPDDTASDIHGAMRGAIEQLIRDYIETTGNVGTVTVK